VNPAFGGRQDTDRVASRWDVQPPRQSGRALGKGPGSAASAPRPYPPLFPILKGQNEGHALSATSQLVSSSAASSAIGIISLLSILTLQGGLRGSCRWRFGLIHNGRQLVCAAHSGRPNRAQTMAVRQSVRTYRCNKASWRCGTLSLETFGISIASFLWWCAGTVRHADSEIHGKSHLGRGDGALGDAAVTATLTATHRAPHSSDCDYLCASLCGIGGTDMFAGFS
jgi:hypothetical protein